MKLLTPAVALYLGLLSATGTAQAALMDRGGGLIYDTDLNVTWLSDANYAMTSGYDADGMMTWANAMTWAANLSYYDSVRNVTYDDWRLPTSDGSCNGYFCTGSEMQHLFTEMGGRTGSSIYGSHDADYGLFSNIEDPYYWSGTSWAYNSAYTGYFSYAFTMLSGNQTLITPMDSNFAWAVRSGDVATAASTVPVPAAAWLLGSGLLGLIGVARRKAA